MRQRSSATADVCCPAAEKRCNDTKANLSKLRSSLYADGIQARRNHAAASSESASASLLSRCCARR